MDMRKGGIQTLFKKLEDHAPTTESNTLVIEREIAAKHYLCKGMQRARY